MPRSWVDADAVRTRIAAWGLAVVLPPATALLFGPDVRWLIIPASLMLMVVVAASFLGGAGAGLVAAGVSTLSLWFVNMPPGFSFALNDRDDALAILSAGLVAFSLAVMTIWLRKRERQGIERREALEWARAVDRETILALQQAVLPTIVPTVRGVSVTASYYAGGELDSPVGGDWFAYLPLDEGRIGVAVGDVVGHGIDAVASMAEYRYTFRAIAADGVDAGAALDRLEALSALLGRRDVFTTCQYAIIDPLEGTLRLANAGHPPPLLIRQGVVRALEGKSGPPVGAFPDHAPYDVTEFAVCPGDVVALYTDGVVERRGESLDLGIERLGSALIELVGTAGERGYERGDLEAVIADLVGPSPSDDAALLVIDIARF